MAGGWPTNPIYAHGVALATNAATSKGTILTTGAINTKGSWIQLIASTTSDITRLLVQMDAYSANTPLWALDIAVAASGSETSGIIIQNLVAIGQSLIQSHIELPVSIKAGSRIAARAASTIATDTPSVQMLGYDTGYTETLNSGLYDTYGYSGSGNPTGISIDPGATANTKGSYTQLTASSTNDLAGFILGFDTTGFVPTVGGDGHTLIDIAVGASGSEVVIVPNFCISKNNFPGGVGLAPNHSTPIWIPIKAGTRIAARCQCADNTTSERLFGLSLYGIRA